MLHDTSLQYRLSRMSDSELDHFRKSLLAEVNGIVSARGQGEQQQHLQQATEPPLARVFHNLQLEPNVATTPSPAGESQHLVVNVE